MAPGIGGGGPTQPINIRETESQAFVEVTKKYVLSMVLDTLAEVIPFTQREYDEVFKYRSESDKPTLHALLFLRLGAPEPYIITEERWHPVYQELFDSLPDHVKDWMAFEMNKSFTDRDPSYVLVNNLLTMTAKALAWLAIANQPIQPNSPAEQNYLDNVALPYIALRSIVNQTETVLHTAQSWLSSVGANYPAYDSLINYLSQVGTSLRKLETLRAEIESGNTSPEIRQKLVETAFEIDRLNTQYQTSGNDLRILGTHLEALAAVTAAWALSSGSPSLLLGITIASIGLASDVSTTGFLGNGYTSTMDSLLNGIISSVIFGARAELEELTGLYNELAGLV
jgi:hypothetical protein